MPAASDLRAELDALGRRPPGSDAERRAAGWVADRLRADPRRHAELRTVWLRPDAVGAQLWHAGLAVGGGLLAVSHPRPGAAVVLIALLAVLADARLGRSLGRWLTRERATQNVISPAPQPRRVRLILTANLDVPRLAPPDRGTAPGWVFWLLLGVLWLLGCAVARYEGQVGATVAALQLAGTGALILAGAVALLAERPGDNAGGVAAVLALTRLLDAAPPANLGVEVIVSGAAGLDGGGLARHLRRERRELTVTNTVVLGFAADAPHRLPADPGAGAVPRVGYLVSDGPLLPVPPFRALAELAAADPALRPIRGRGSSPSLAARRRDLPALTLTGDPDRMVTAALELVDRLDVHVAGVQARAAAGSDRGDRVVLGRPVPRLLRRQREA